MTLQGGDREYGHGDEITVEYDDSTDAVGGEGVYVSGHSGDHPFVQLADDSNGVDAVLGDGATDGDTVKAHFDGAVWARVADGDDAAAGETVGTDTGMTDGVLTDSGSDYLVLEGEATDNESSEKVALVQVDN